MVAVLNTDIRQNIEQALAGAFSSSIIAWPGLDFSAPNSLWLRPYTVIAGEMPEYFTKDKITGVLVVEVFTPLNTGAADLYNAIATLQDTFYRQKINNLYFHSVEAIRQLTENDQYLGMAIDFQFIGYSIN